MLLTVDMGNTTITLGAFRDDELVFTARLSTIRGKTADQYAIELCQIFALNEVGKSDFHAGIMSSVVPELTDTLKRTLTMVTGSEPVIVCPGIKTGINVLIDNPAQLGADLLVGAVAAAEKYPLPCLIVDLGTASKISVVGKDKSFRGVAIAPGVRVSLNALSSSTSQLPNIPLTAPGKIIGTNTVESMQSGIIFGTAAMVDGMIRRMKDELKADTTVIVTGGYSARIAPYCREKVVHDEFLIMEGLRIIYEKNSQRTEG